MKLLPIVGVVRDPGWIDKCLQQSPLKLHKVESPEVGEVEMPVGSSHDVHAVGQRGEGGGVEESRAWLRLGLVGREGNRTE